jgi:hypothetical protein
MTGAPLEATHLEMQDQENTPQTLQEAKIGFYLRFINYLMDQIRLHGLSFIMLTLAVLWFYKENTKLTEEVKNCNSTMIEIYRNDKIRMEALINNNTQAFEQLKQYIKIYNLQ